MRRMSGLALAVMLGAFSGFVQADIKLAIQPAPYLETRSEAEDVFAAAAALWFQESLGRAPGVELVPEARNSAIFQEIGSGAWESADPNLQLRYARYEPLDAVLSFSRETGKARIILDTASGRKTFTPASLARASLMKELGRAAAFLAENLKLSPEAAAAAAQLPALDGETFATLCQASRTTVQWPRNTGEGRLVLLQPVWKKWPAEPRVCAGVLLAAGVQLSSKTRENTFNATASNMARMALPPVLGTPFESAAAELAQAAPELAVPELKTIMAGLLKEVEGGKIGAALDDVLAEKDDGAMAAPVPAAGGAWASGSFTRAQMLGALRVLASLDSPESRKLLGPMENHPDSAVKKELADARAATNAPPARDPVFAPDPPEARLLQLANDPYGPVAAEACRRLAGQRPASGMDAVLFDLATAHPLERQRLLERLAADKPAWEEAVLEKTAAANPDPYARAAALQLLSERAPAKACALALQALQGDGHRWLRLQAATVLAVRATPADAAGLGSVLEAARNPAVRLGLEEALARASGKPLPPARAAARKVDGERNLAWMCGMGRYGVESPFDAYYCLSMPTDGALWKKAYDAGKIFFVRLSTVGHPGLIALNRQYRDRFWLDIESQLTPDVLPLVDGLVFGEETMSMAPDGLWKDGWRLFCQNAKLDPARVNGKLENLSGPEKQAWQSWSYERAVDGFNMMYDFVKRRYARERPGLQVATFLPGEPSTPGLRRWKFDVGGIYDYKCDSRMSAYNLVRRIKTLWPGRPVIWLSFGIGGYEMNPVKRGLQVPAVPMATRRIRCYADSVAAWLAGADTGWFSVWMFVDNKFSGVRSELAGVQVGVEDIAPDSELLRKGIEYSFKGAETELTEPKAPAKAGGEADWEGGKVDAQEMADLADLVVGRDKSAEAKASVDERKAAFKRGFLLYQKYVYDCARVCKSLPRLPDRREPVLAVHPEATVWTLPPTVNPVVPGMALLNGCDFLSDLKDAAQLDLSAYRIIMVRDPGALPSPVVSALLAWLEKSAGLLYIQGGFSEAEWGTSGDLDGRLAREWPWKGEVLPVRQPAVAGRTVKPLNLTGAAGDVAVKGGRVACSWTLAGERAKPLLSGPEGAVLAVWRDPQFKGVVVFDGVESASKEYVLALRGVLLAEGGAAAAGLLEGPVLHESVTVNGLTAAATTGYYKDVSDRKAYAGLDLLTGEANPEAGGGMSGVLAASGYRSGLVAVTNGIALLAERPFERVEGAGSGVEFKGGGLVRVAGAGALRVEAKEGAPLAAVSNAAVWIVEGTSEGYAEVMAGTNRVVMYVRSARDVTVRLLR